MAWCRRVLPTASRFEPSSRGARAAMAQAGVSKWCTHESGPVGELSCTPCRSESCSPTTASLSARESRSSSQPPTTSKSRRHAATSTPCWKRSNPRSARRRPDGHSHAALGHRPGDPGGRPATRKPIPKPPLSSSASTRSQAMRFGAARVGGRIGPPRPAQGARSRSFEPAPSTSKAVVDGVFVIPSRRSRGFSRRRKKPALIDLPLSELTASGRVLAEIAQVRSNTAIADSLVPHEAGCREAHQRDLPQARPLRGRGREQAGEGGPHLPRRRAVRDAGRRSLRALGP